ncbi:iron-containing alcohol dehydrogenase [Candidatus Borrarchaeum sp.]|uniref:iron-containing alcohol dehydrogenase family protein n=1 Tax=Candidatus Borrarchaeum sp. TaxID=2846742 RepID=UPI00257E8FDA|nr:iron-containing alcohol dehydrogenase [Candidatus Borrarchaeum sp.]
MNGFKFYLPTRVVFEKGALSRIGEFASRFGKKCLLMTGKNFARKHGYTDDILEKLSNFELRTHLFEEVEPNPTKKTVLKAVDNFLNNECEVIIAFGGGSVIDAAKAVALISKLGGQIEDYFFPNIVEKEIYPVIAIPTTCGTGSEATRYAVITDNDEGLKKTISGDPLVPRIALLDVNNLKHIPKEVFSNTSADTFCHAIESFVNIKYTHLSDLFAKESIKFAFDNVVEAYKGNEDSKEHMLYASLLAGVAINFSGSTAVHALGYYLTSKHGIPHGLASAVFLLPVLEYEKDSISDRIYELAYAMRLKQTDPEYFINALNQKFHEIGIIRSLLDLGIGYGEKENIIRKALLFSRNLDNNPVKLEVKDLTTIVDMAYTR